MTDASDAELCWGLRGGGGDFALVTSLEFDLYIEAVIAPLPHAALTS